LTWIHPLVLSAWHRREEEEPEATLPKPLPLSLFCFDHHCRRRPPMVRRHPAGPLALPHIAGTRPSRPTLPLDVAIAHRGRQVEAERHRPPPEPSPRRQTCHDPTDRFPEVEPLERDHARRPVHVDVSRSGRPARPERASHSRAPRPRLTPPFTCTSTTR
jgi:hypothetical protein